MKRVKAGKSTTRHLILVKIEGGGLGELDSERAGDQSGYSPASKSEDIFLERRCATATRGEFRKRCPE